MNGEHAVDETVMEPRKPKTDWETFTSVPSPFCAVLPKTSDSTVA